MLGQSWECNTFTEECHLQKERARSRVRWGCHHTEMPTRWRLGGCSGTKMALTQQRGSMLGGISEAIMPLLCGSPPDKAVSWLSLSRSFVG